MYTPGMSVMSLLLKNRYENKRIEISFMEKENAFVFFSFPKKNFCPFGCSSSVKLPRSSAIFLCRCILLHSPE